MLKTILLYAPWILGICYLLWAAAQNEDTMDGTWG